MEILNSRGPIIGYGSETPFSQETMQLHKGDRVVLYTDGLLESRNSAGVLFGKSQFYDALKKHRNESIQLMVDAVGNTVQNFRENASPDDDISILGVEYAGEDGLHYSI
jgi:sigma-B regulation protein RsbU (phosphoserine phosphatase)